MSNPLRLALVGIDHPHGAHWRELLAHFPELQVVGLVPGLDGGLASLEERWAESPRFATVEALLAGTDCDAALVCLDNAATPDAIERLAAAGKHLLVEKPVAGGADAARRALEAVERAGVAFQSGYMWRYDEGAGRLRRMVADGQFGQLISVEMTFVTSDVNRRGPDHYLFDKSRSGGGFFNWLACHYLDLLRYVTDQPVAAVTARTGVFGGRPVEVEDGGAALLELQHGALATFVGGYWLPRWAGEAQWVVRGTSRWVRWDPGDGGGRLDIHGPQPQWHAMEDVFRVPQVAAAGYGGVRGVALVRDWIDAIREGRPCRNTPRSTLETLELLDAIQRSSDEGRRVALAAHRDDA